MENQPQTNTYDHQDLSGMFSNSPHLFLEKIKELRKDRANPVKIKIALNYETNVNLSLLSESEIDDLIIENNHFNRLEFKDIKFNKFTFIDNLNRTSGDFSFSDCTFNQKIIFKFKGRASIAIQNSNPDNIKNISINLANEPSKETRLSLKNYNLVNSNFKSPILLNASNSNQQPAHIKNSSFEYALKINNTGDYVFSNDDNLREANILNSITFSNPYNAKFTNFKKIGDIICQSNDNKLTITLNSCCEIGNILTNQLTALEINEDSKNLNLTKIKKIEIAEGLDFLYLKNCQIEEFQFFGKLKNGFILDDVSFVKTPKIGNVEFLNCNVEIRKAKFVDANSPLATAGFRALNLACHKANYEMGVIFFHGLELETRYNSHLKNIKFFNLIHCDYPEKILSFLNKIFTNYGRNLSLPIIYNIVISLAFFSTFYLINLQECSFNFNELFKLALQNFLGPMEHLLGKKFINEDFFGNLSTFTLFCLFFNKLFSYGIWMMWFFMIRRRFKI